MLDFNHRLTLSEQISAAIDAALQAERAAQTPRDYLGASRVGAACERQLQYEYAGAPVDAGREFKGSLLGVFDAGHVFEELAIRWLCAAGFDLVTRTAGGDQIGFAAAGGRLRGHVDGIVVAAPAHLGCSLPMLWECKTMHDASWKDTVKHGVARSKPVYAAQIALYQAYLGLTEHPAVFTAVNKDTCELWHELVPFNGALAQAASDKAVRILQACDAGEWLPRVSADPEHFECAWCAWRQRCWA